MYSDPSCKNAPYGPTEPATTGSLLPSGGIIHFLDSIVAGVSKVFQKLDIIPDLVELDLHT